MSKKTVFVPITQGFWARYFLQTDIFKNLQLSGHNIIILTKDVNDTFFDKYRSFENVKIERYFTDKYQKYASSGIEGVLHIVRRFTLNKRYNIRSTDDAFKIYKNDIFKTSITIKNITEKIIVLVIIIMTFFCRRSRFLRKFLLFIEHVFFTPSIHQELFKKYNPCFLIVPSLGNLPLDAFIMREAKKNNVEVITIILSWDNPSTKGMPGAVSDYVIAWTDIMKKELITLNDIKEEKIFVGGIVHFDHYGKKDTFYKRDYLFKKLRLDPNKKVIIFGTKSPNTYPWNHEIAEVILEKIKKNAFVKPCQLIVRLHPIYYRMKDGEYIHKYFLDKFEELNKNYPELILNKPEILSENIDFAMSDEEIKLLASLLKNSDIMINIFSTLNLDACIFDVPIINICFHGNKYDGPSKSRYNVFLDEVQTHNQRVIKAGGVAVAYSENELIEHINNYLLKPSLHSEERRKIFNQEIGAFYGMAGERVSKKILEIFDK